MLWEIILKVEAKKLSEVLEAIDGKVVDMELRGIRGALVKRGKKAIAESEPVGGSMAEKVAHLISAAKAKALQRDALKEMIKTIGGNPDGLPYYVKGLRDLKVLGVYNSEKGEYNVLAKKVGK